jgi:hypothetical protein
MSTYKISVDQFLRLASVISFFGSTVTEETKAKINAIRLENKNGRSVAVATNQKVASIENLGPTQAPNGVCHLKVNKDMIEAAKNAKDKLIFIVVTVIPEIALSSCEINGKHFHDVALWLDSTPLDQWRSWVVPPPSASSGIMCWDIIHLETLLQSSPSGKVVFPEFIDATKPVTIRDRHKHGEWIGVFLPHDRDLAGLIVDEIKSLKIPSWIN